MSGSFRLVSTPHKKRVPGFPLDSLSVDISSGRYYYDLEEETIDADKMDEGFCAFFQQALPYIE